MSIMRGFAVLFLELSSTPFCINLCSEKVEVCVKRQSLSRQLVGFYSIDNLNSAM